MASVMPAFPSALKTEKGEKAEGVGRAFFTSEEQKAFSETPPPQLTQALSLGAKGESLGATHLRRGKGNECAASWPSLCCLYREVREEVAGNCF